MLFSVVVLLLFQNIESESRLDLVVNTNVGLIRGLQAADGNYSMFLGIPYGKVDEKNPFGVSTPYPEFENIYDAFDDSQVCPQTHQSSGGIVGTIDCLNLNIYVPTLVTSNNKLPVMVWIYGGGFHNGLATTAFYGPQYLVKHDVIVVTFNYRVNAYGFMCLDIPEIPGNQGLKDQELAFHWIKRNIAEFGGDPDKITIFGESAGGHSIDLNLMFSKKILYNNVILQSGSAEASTVLYDPDRSAPVKLAQHLGYATNNTYNALTFLSNAEPGSVVAALTELQLVFKPCVETEFDGVEPLITKHWVNAEVPNVKNISVMLGYNEHEMAHVYMNQDESYFKNLDLVTDRMKQLFQFDSDDMFIEIRNEVSHFYFGEEEMSEALKWKIIEYDSDATYIDPVHRTLRNYLRSGANNMFLYMFSFVGGRNRVVIDTDPLCCAAHADDLGYLWEQSHAAALTESDTLTVDRMTTMWTNFAKYSDPTPEITELLPVKWKPVTNSTLNYLRIDKELSEDRRPFNRRMIFWELFYKLYGKYQKNYE